MAGAKNHGGGVINWSVGGDESCGRGQKLVSGGEGKRWEVPEISWWDVPEISWWEAKKHEGGVKMC